MISLINGVVRSLAIDRAVVEVGGVGLAISITPATSASLNIGAPAQFFTSLVVREDSLTLYGFLDDDVKALFELVQTVSGIGPKVALSLVAALSPSQLGLANPPPIEVLPNCVNCVDNYNHYTNTGFPSRGH